MKKKRKTTVVVIAILFSFFFCGCTQKENNVTTVPEEKTGGAKSAVEGPALPPDFVEVRIGMYEKFLEKKEISEKDRETVRNLLSNYRKIRTTLDKPVSEEYYREITHILFDTIILLDEGYLLINAPEIKTEMAKPEERSEEMPRREGVISTALPVDLLDNKISTLEKYADLKKISDADRETAHLLLTDYMRMKTANTSDMSDMNAYYREISHLLFDSIIMLEERYFFKENDEASSKNAGALDEARFSVSTEGVIMDADTGLEWVVGPDTDTNYGEAAEWVSECNIAGGGWRMPTKVEISGLYREGAGELNMDPLFETTGGWVWAEPYDSSSAWNFDFRNFGNYKSDRNAMISKRAFGVRSHQ